MDWRWRRGSWLRIFAKKLNSLAGHNCPFATIGSMSDHRFICGDKHRLVNRCIVDQRTSVFAPIRGCEAETGDLGDLGNLTPLSETAITGSGARGTARLARAARTSPAAAS